MKLKRIHAVLVITCLSVISHGREIQVDLHAPWRQHVHDPLLEVAEFMSEESNLHFWRFVDGACEKSNAIHTIIENSLIEAPISLQNLAFDISGADLSPATHDLLKASVQLGTYTPSLQFYESISKKFNDPCNGRAFMIEYPSESIMCSLSDGRSDKSSDFQLDDSKYASWDHIYPGKNKLKFPFDNTHENVVVLYGVIGSASFCHLHRTLKEQTMLGNSHYIMRHHSFNKLDASSNSSTPSLLVSQDRRLFGYGVYLDIKNMEYRNLNDESAEDSKEDITEEEKVHCAL